METSARWLILTLHETTLLQLVALLTGGSANPAVVSAQIARIRSNRLI
jgi:hypothetical protein